MAATRDAAAALLGKYGIPARFLDAVAGDDLEGRVAALAGALVQHWDGGTAQRAWFLPPIVMSDPATGRRVPQGVDVRVAGRTFAGGRWHRVSDEEVRELEAAGYAARIFRGEFGSEAMSAFEQALPVEKAGGMVREQLRVGRPL
jgi:hypothetical protein